MSSNITTALLSRAHSPTSTQRIMTEKIQNRPLLLKPSTASDTNARQQRRQQQERRRLATRRKRLKPRPLSAREKRALLGTHDMTAAAERKYALYEPLHGLWVGYMRELLGSGLGLIGGAAATATAAAARLASADFHGADLLVVRSRCVSRVGLRGIVVRDSMSCFVLVTRADEVKVVPKEHTLFRFEVPPAPATATATATAHDGHGGEEKAGEGKQAANLVFELHGDQFRYRAADRANKKFKTHFLPDL